MFPNYRFRDVSTINYEKFNTLSWRYFVLSQKNFMTNHYIKSLDVLIRERKKHRENPNNVVIHPLSIFRMYWDATLIAAYFIHFFVRPLYISIFFFNGHEGSTPWNVLIFFSFLVFLLDIDVNLNSGYYNSYEKKIILDREVVRKNYVKGFLIPDLISIIPLDFFIVMWNWQHEYYYYSQIFPLIRIIRFPTFLKHYINLVKMLCQNKIPKRFIQHFMILICILNTSACCYTIMGTIYVNGVIIAADDLETMKKFYSDLDIYSRYIICILLTFSSMSTAGFGILFPSKLFEMILMLLLILVHGFYKIYLCALFSDEIRGLKTVSSQYLEMKDEIEQYMQHKQLPEETQKRFLEYFNFRYQQKYFREKKLMSALTENLRSEVIYYTYSNVINSPVFEHVPKELMGEILSRLHYEVFLPNDIITRSGTSGTCMYFVLRGTLAVYTSSGQEIYHLDDGDYFGEISLVADGKRSETTVALEVSELLRLDKNDFIELIASDENILRAMESGVTEKVNRVFSIVDRPFGRSHSIFRLSSM